MLRHSLTGVRARVGAKVRASVESLRRLVPNEDGATVRVWLARRFVEKAARVHEYVKAHKHYAKAQEQLGRVIERAEQGLETVRSYIPANDDKVETAFLPAALEVVETPPSPAGRILLYSICAFFVIALLWSYFGKVDLVATAQGHIIPSGKVKTIQPLEIGVIRKIDVTEGQHVAAGDVLVEIDPTESQAETERLTSELMQYQVDAARLTITAKATGPGDAAEQAFLGTIPKDADPALVARQLALMRSALAEQAATLAGIDSDIAQKQAEQKQVQSEIDKLDTTLPLIRKRSELREKLVAQGYSSVMDASKERQSLIESEQDLVSAQHKLDESTAAISQLNEQRREAVAKFVSTTLTSLADDETKASDTEQQLVKAKDLAEHRTLTSPVDGVVQQLAIHTVGGVVTPAQELMVVVPKGVTLEVEAMVQNKDIGFVHVGQKAEIKVETFPFTRYGLRHGRVLDVSRDAVTPPQQSAQGKNNADGNGNNSDTAQAAQQPQDSVYTARISLDQDSMQVDGQPVPLSPGMVVTAEIKTGRQRIIDYLLDPLRRYRHDSFRER